MFYSDFNKWLGDALTNILLAISALIDALNPMSYVVKLGTIAIALLPEPADLEEFYDTYILVMNWLAPSLQLINHFVNLPVFGAAFMFILIVENTINVFRAWRTIRSFVT